MVRVMLLLLLLLLLSVLYCADQWDVQSIVKRIVAELQHKDYLVWFDCASLAAPACLADYAQLLSHAVGWSLQWRE